MNHLAKFLIVLFGSIATVVPAEAQTGKKVPLIVELFTSEGCSTCPPADKYFRMLIEKQPIAGAEIIGLSEHVDYWNQDGWIDSFSAAQYSGRQKYYAAFFKRMNIYTPQMVVDGTHEINVKDGDKALIEIAQSPKGQVNLEVSEDQENSVQLKIKISDLPKIADGENRVVLLAITEDALTSNVSGGENSGRKLQHTAVTRYLKNIGAVAGAESADLTAEIPLDKTWRRDHLSAVVFVQETGSRRIIGAARIKLGS